MTEIRFDDIETLKSKISDEYGPWSERRMITQEDVTAFGELTGDMQWIHVDPERAKSESAFGTTIAHGFFVLSLLARLRKSDGISIIGHGNALNYGIERLRFIGPVPVGSPIHCRTRVEGVALKDNGTMVDFGVAVHVVGQERPCLVFVWKLFYRP